MIEARNLQKQFGTFSAVQDVSLCAQDGQITGLLGHNGAGKSTTLRMLTGLLEPNRGTVHIDGVDLQQDPEAGRRRMGVLPDSRGLYLRLTAREHLHYYGELQALSGGSLRERTSVVLKQLKMEAIADRRVEGFSQGERTKVALARALVHDPRNILLDEPTHGLDVLSTRALREFLLSLKVRGYCILFSSHVMQEIETLCDHVLIMSRGKLVAQGTPEALCAQTGCASIEDAFVRLSESSTEAP